MNKGYYNIGDILIAKDNDFEFVKGIHKYDKVVISHKYNDTWRENFNYRIDSKDTVMILSESEITFHFWILAEYRKLKINELL